VTCAGRRKTDIVERLLMLAAACNPPAAIAPLIVMIAPDADRRDAAMPKARTPLTLICCGCGFVVQRTRCGITSCKAVPHRIESLRQINNTLYTAASPRKLPSQACSLL